jgi:predicted nucleotide-binding protein
MAILIVEDDVFYAGRLQEMLSDRGVETISVQTAEEALAVPPESYEAAIVDVMLPNDPVTSGISSEESRAGFLTGVAVARRLRNRRSDLKIVLITNDERGSESEQWADSQNVPIAFKSEGPRGIRGALQELGVLNGRLAPRAFIVHGHDDIALLQLKNYLQNTLHWPEPVVLREKPNCGRTLIEKFEEFSGQIDCAFVLLTPDDAMVLGSSNERRRSRQNVIFELGFFLAQLGRQSGRIIVLHKGPNELPSDIQGVVWIAIDNGVDAAGEQIRKEVAQFTAGLAAH